MQSPLLKPVDFNKNEPVWVITVGSQTGIGAMYGQGMNWDTCQPAGFLSKKFTSTQHNYHMHEHETPLCLLRKPQLPRRGLRLKAEPPHISLNYHHPIPHLQDHPTWVKAPTMKHQPVTWPPLSPSWFKVCLPQRNPLTGPKTKNWMFLMAWTSASYNHS